MRILMCMALVVVAGCTGVGTVTGLGDAGFSDSCDARAQQRLIGSELTDMAAIAGAAPKVRFIRPDDAVTQDVQSDRLNVELDANDRVTRVYCG